MQAGETVLVLLAAANPQPQRFDLFRKNRQLFTFGVGAHACPGERLASMIATASVLQLLEMNLDLESLAACVRYRPSTNVHIPLFG